MLLACLFVATDATAQKKKVHTIGDSTMQTYADTDTKRGWGQMLQQFFNANNITVNNRGKSGASSKSFYKESAFWPTLVTGGTDQMQSGDILVIQFAHNDEKSNGTDGDEVNALGGDQVDYRGTTPYDTYKKTLRDYINEAKKMGVKPILCGPICRKYLKDDGGKKVNRAGRHDLGDGFSKIVEGKVTTGNKIAADDHTMDYPYQMQQVAMEYDDVPYIDLTTATKEMYESYGDAYCTSNIFCPDDGTHPGPMGATLIARLFATLVHNQANGGETDAKRAAVLQELDADIVLSSDISFSPTTGDMGSVYAGQTLVKEFNVSGFGLTPAEGNVKFTVDGDYTISTDKQNYGKSAEVSYDGSTLIKTIYVKIDASGTGELKGTLTASNGATSSNLALSTKIVSLEGGVEVSAVWPLTTDDKAITTGPIDAIGESWEGMKVANYNNINSAAVWPEESGYDASHKTQRNGTLDGSWPAGEIDEVSTRYIQFAVQAPAETDINVDKISMYVAGAGGSGMRCKVYYSTNSNFADPQQIYANTSMAGNTAYYVEAKPTFKISEGERLYIRVYPWYNGAASGKTICLSDVTVHGYATAAESGQAEMDPTIYNFGMGRELSEDGTAFVDAAEKLIGKAPEHVTVTLLNGSCNNYSSGSGNVTHGTTTNIAADGRIRNWCKTHNAAVKDFDDHIFWGFKVAIDEGYQLNINKIFGDFYAEKNGCAYKMGVFTSDAEDATPLYMSDVKNISNIQTIGSDNVATTIDATEIAALKELTGTVYLRFYWWINSAAAGAVLKDFNIDAQIGKAATTTKYALKTSVTPEGAGTISVDPDLSAYKEGSKVTLTAKKNFGYKFVEWQDAEGATVSNDATTSVTMDAAKTLTAVFETVPVYTVDALVKNDLDLALGSVTLTPNEHNGKYEEGTQVTLKAESSKILKFMNWEDNSTANPRSITVDKDMTVTANYEIQDFIAVFDASTVEGYADRVSYPFRADMTWDNQRNATSQIVRVDNGTAVKGQGSTPVVRNRKSVVLSSINGLYQNGYNTTDIAWQYQFSTKGFTSARIEADMAAKNAASKNWKAQYSLDGTTYTDIKEWQVTANTQTPIELVLPADAVGKDMVYVRITGVGEEIAGASYAFDKDFEGMRYASNSESGVGNLYILGEAETVADEVAPKLTSTIPVANATGIPASGNIVISFDEKIQLSNKVNGIATLNGETLTPVASAKSVSFQYVNLEYGKTYTFKMPAGYVEDKSGNAADAVELSFTVMERQKPTARIFDAVVDKTLDLKYGESIAATETMPKQYRYIQDAINDAPAASTKPYLIYIKEGYYDDANPYFNDSYGQRYDLTKPDGKGAYEVINNSVNGNGTDKSDPSKKYDDCKLIFINKPNIHLIGQATDKVTIATDRMDGGDASRPEKVWYHVNAGAAVEIQKGGDDALLSTLTIDNENWTKEKKAGPQALCLNTEADRLVFNELNVQSYQDDYKCSGTYNRAFWFKSRFEGAVDYIYGDCDVWFEECIQDICRDKGGYIVAPSHPLETRWGYVFNNNIIKSSEFSADCQVWLGRPWHNYPKTVFMNTKVETKTYDLYWAETMGGLPAIWAVKNLTDKNGVALTEESRSSYYADQPDGHFAEGTYTSKEDLGNGKFRFTNANTKNSLSNEELAEYTIQNVLSGDKTTEPSGYWNPLTQVEKTATPAVTVNGNIAKWTADEYAICYVVTVNGKPSAFVTDAQYVGTEGEVVTVQSVNENGILSAMSQEVTLTTATSVIAVEDTTGSARTATGIYTIDGKKTNNAEKGIVIINGVKTARK